ncbi:MAG: sigma-70 family RNA polymerase sigma factor [Cytophagales bacterium]|nr:sigma-70 family RNA polymerase sigma factor [Cytophagales bacterium]
MLKDEKIINAIKEGRNQEIVHSLYKTVLPDVKRFIQKNGGNNEQAEDMFQEAIVTLIMNVKAGRFKEGNSIAAYMKAIVRNKWYDLFKAKLKEEEAVQQIYENEKIKEQKISEEQIKTVQKLLDSLDKQCQKLLRFSVFEGHSYAQVAELTQMASEAVVKTSMYRCRKKLKTKAQSIPGLLKRLEF